MLNHQVTRLGRACCVIFTLIIAGPVSEGAISWIGPGGNWDTDHYWSDGVEPTEYHDAILDKETVLITLLGEQAYRVYVGYSGYGTLQVLFGGQLDSNSGLLGYDVGSRGDVTVADLGSRWTNSEDLWVGYLGVGRLNIRSGGQVSNGKGYIGRLLDATGEVDVAGAGSTWQNTDILRVGSRGSGTLKISDDGSVNIQNSLILGELVTGTGTVNLSGGTLDLHGSNIAQGAGTATFNFTGGTLKDVGVFKVGSGLVHDGGTLAPGSSPGSMQIVGDYDLNAGSLEIELAGLTPGSGHDFVDVTGTLNLGLGSVLDVLLIDAFIPSAGDSFDILDFASITGSFSAVNLPTLDPGLSWDTSELPTTGTIAVVPEPATLVMLGLMGAAVLGRRPAV